MTPKIAERAAFIKIIDLLLTMLKDVEQDGKVYKQDWGIFHKDEFWSNTQNDCCELFP